MATSAIQFITPIHLVEVWHLQTFTAPALWPDGATVVMHQAFDPLSGAPVGPEGGDPNPAYVRLFMAERHPAALECQIVSVVQQ